MNTDNIDRFGHCVSCHKNLITKRIIDGREQEVFLPIHGHTTFLLKNGSQMEVCMCKPCQQCVQLDDPIVHHNIMEAVHKGWQLETKLLVENGTWDKEHGEKYLNHMKNHKIDCHIQHLSTSFVQNRIKELTHGNHINS